MYTTIRIYAGKSALGDELRRNQETVKAAISAVPGFRSYQFINTSDGGGASITVCDDEAGAEASTRAAAAWIAENLPNSFAAPAVSSGEVVIAF